LTADEARNFAHHWIAAWNAHDLNQIMSHYDDAIELISPTAARLLALPDGKVTGKANLRAYFEKGLNAFPELRFELKDVLLGIDSILLYYANQKGTHTGEFMELTSSGKVVRVVANYSA
jgi:ketosteroid isomerase-like protein